MSGFDAKGVPMSESMNETVTPKFQALGNRFLRANSGSESVLSTLSRFSPSPLRFDLARCAIDAASSDSVASELGAVGFLLYSRIRPFARFLVRRVALEKSTSSHAADQAHFYCWADFAVVGPNGAKILGQVAYSHKRDAIATPSHIYFLANPKIFINRKLGHKCRRKQRASSPHTTMSLLFFRLLQAWRSKRTKSSLLTMLQKTIRGQK